MLSHMLDCQLFGLNPWGHHLTSVLFHAFNAVLVFVLLRQLTGAMWRSLLVAALFAVHPLRVESVAWVSERKDVLSAFFGLLSLIAYTRYVRKPEAGSQKPETNLPTSSSFLLSPFYWLSLFFFALGLMSKPMLVTWPFVMLLLDYWPLERFKPGRAWQLVMEKIPFLVLPEIVHYGSGGCLVVA
jgi:protein O-mannosyl-transferase